MSITNMNSKAWDILLEEEKAALSLSINHAKSTWQAGEILDKAHYKYLEIHARAKHFFVMFTEYFKKTGGHLIPLDSEIAWDFREFLTCTIEQRKGYRETLKIIGKTSALCGKYAKERDDALYNFMEWLRKHPQPIHRELYKLVKDFDRWNNFRILPESMQEPSAFKRRNKTRFLKHLKNIHSLPPIVIDQLHTKAFRPTKMYPVLYLPIISDNYIKGYDIIEVSRAGNVVEYISKKLNLYLFEDRDFADDYAHMVENYITQKDKHCTLGQTFWPKFREMVKSAYNYNEVNNIVSRKNTLEEAFKNVDKVKVKKLEDKENNSIIEPGEERVKIDKLWNL